jgi:DNA-directed RNA polymerase subunit K/omega
VTPLAACLHYIGADEQAKLIKKAYEEGYDALLVFEVEVAQNRQTRVVNNSARVKAIIPAETQKEAKIVYSTSELVNVTVARAKQKSQNDGVEDAANRLVKKLVEAIALKDIPEKLTPEAIVSNRIPKLLKEEELSKLEKLGEINFYYSRGFIDESQRDDFFNKIAGKFASQLMTGSEEEKDEAIDELLGD